MMDFEFEEAKRKDEEAEAAAEPPAPPFYDPLLSPWEDNVPTAHLLRPEEEPVFRLSPGWRGREEEGGWPGRAGEYRRPYGEREEFLTDAQRRLLEGTVTLPRAERRWGVTIRELAETVLLALLIFLAVRASFQNFRVEGASMQPSLENGEYLIVNKLAYAQIDLSMFNWLPFYDAGASPVHHLWGSPDRGDVIVFRSPTNLNRDFIKRVIGIPGDKLEVRPQSSEVLVNGKVLDEPYTQGATTCVQTCTWTVPADSFFVMGDNRSNSSDSRQGWFVPEENIIGKTLVTYWHDGGPELGLAPNHSVSLSSKASAKE
ncbi:MAG TPA: signal peptidase I [Dehalococcoidia bacterium]|nr:signal peptidase I [Dehalococcoidia bacterium]